MSSQKKEPNLFIIGAPKCGTTSMIHYFSQHPEIFVCPVKEPHYFNMDSKHRYHFTEQSYLSLFSKSSQYHTYLCEGSVWYLYSKEAVRNILNFNPSTKFIVMLRNPTFMYYSLHEQFIFSGNETEKSPKKAWYLQDERKKGNKIPKMALYGELLMYHQICSLGVQVQRLLEIVPKTQVHFILFDDLEKDVDNEYNRTLDFLKLKNLTLPTYEIKNKRKRLRLPYLNKLFYYNKVIKAKIGIKGGTGIANYLRKNNTLKNTKVSFEEEKKTFTPILKKYFKDDIMLLSQLIDRDLSHWYT